MDERSLKRREKCRDEKEIENWQEGEKEGRRERNFVQKGSYPLPLLLRGQKGWWRKNLKRP